MLPMLERRSLALRREFVSSGIGLTPHTQIRAARIPLHLTRRSNYRQPVFFGDEDRTQFLALLSWTTTPTGAKFAFAASS